MPDFDLAVIGAGINGAGIARDAAGRGLRVLLVERGDIGGATSSASTKLIHGGLRYLEHYDFALVRESLAEREVMLRIAPHLVREQRFVIPLGGQQRPEWMIRFGLFLYDRLGGRSSLQRSQALALAEHPAYGAPLQPAFRRACVYSDLWVDDARLTLINSLSAAEWGATVLVRTQFETAQRDATQWRLRLREASGAPREITARAIINAAGPWAQYVRESGCGFSGRESLRLVQGSHLVVPRLYQGEHAYLLQSEDGRVVFVIPFESEFSLIGTTDTPLTSPDEPARLRPAEAEYLCRVVRRFLRDAVRPEDAVWSYAGVRALYDDGRPNASAVTREYRLIVDGNANEAPLLSVYGGKLTTYRRLAERALVDLAPWFPGLGAPWTHRVPLPGGELGSGGIAELEQHLASAHPQLPHAWLRAVSARHGSRAQQVIGAAATEADLGTCFGGGLYAREVDYFRHCEWAVDAEDILWRRTKCGLHMTSAQCDVLVRYIDPRPGPRWAGSASR